MFPSTVSCFGVICRSSRLCRVWCRLIFPPPPETEKGWKIYLSDSLFMSDSEFDNILMGNILIAFRSFSTQTHIHKKMSEFLKKQTFFEERQIDQFTNGLLLSFEKERGPSLNDVTHSTDFFYSSRLRFSKLMFKCPLLYT